MPAKSKTKKGKIVINQKMCKSCGFCIEYCPKKSIELTDQYNPLGYFPAQSSGKGCTGCGICATVCPEAIIEVWRE